MATLGAFAFGVVVGWFVYFTNRYRKGDASFADLTALIGVVGGGAVTALFGEGKTDLFGAYGIGLAIGFFAYFATLILLVQRSGGAFAMTWFLDGRRKKLPPDQEIPAETRPTVAAMELRRAMLPRTAAATALGEQAADEKSSLATANEEQERAIEAVSQALRDLMDEIGRTADPVVRADLVDAERLLSQKLDELVALRLKDILESPQVRDALAKLGAITGDLVATAKEMKTAEDKLKSAAKLIDRASKLIGFLTALA
jgi:hypothetical protein